MKMIDLTPLYRNTIGFDRMESLLDSAFQSDVNHSSYPPYDIEALDENRYTISVAVAGFEENELDIEVESDVLTIKGQKSKDDDTEHHFLHRGIATRSFERKFNLAQYVEICNAKLNNGLLTIELKQEIPEAMKPRRIEIETETNPHLLERLAKSVKAA